MSWHIKYPPGEKRKGRPRYDSQGVSGSESKVVKAVVAEMKKDPTKNPKYLVFDQINKTGSSWGLGNIVARLVRKVQNKLRQPFRRKARGPLRKRAAGKNEVRGGKRR